MNPQQTDPYNNQPGRPAQSNTPSPSGQPLHAQPPNLPTPTPDPIQPHPEYSSAAPTPQHKPPRYALRGLLSIVQLVVGAAVLAFIINHLIFQPYEVFGHSMVPSLNEGDRLIVSKLGRTWATITRDEYLPERGEIIVFHNPNSTQVQLVKRVVGLPGEHVVVKNGTITVYTPEEPNGFNFDKRFGLPQVETLGDVNLTIPPHEIFVVGDNRTPNGSLDSRNELGTVPLDQVVGDLVFRIFPISDAAVF